MGFIDRNLMEGERLVYRTRLHWAMFLPQVALMVVLAAATVAVLAYRGGSWTYLPLVLLAIMVLGGLGKYVTYLTSEFGVTTHRVLIKVGLLSIRSTEILLSKVEAMQIEQSIGGRILNYGTIIITGTGGTHEVFHMIEAPYELRNQVQGQLLQPREQHAPEKKAPLRF